MFERKFWEKRETWEKVVLYILILPFIIARIALYLIATAVEYLYKGFCFVGQILWSFFVEYFWIFVHACGRGWEKCKYGILWFKDIRRNKSKQKALKRVAILTLIFVFSVSLLISFVSLRNYVEEKKVYDALEHKYCHDYYVSYGDSWWSIAAEHCPDYMYLSNSDTSVCNYLKLLYEENDGGGFDLYPGMIVRVPYLP
jgi:hypothetical protein